MKYRKIKTSAHKLHKKIIDVDDSYLEYLLLKNYNYSDESDDGKRSFKEKKIKLFIFLIKLADKYLPEEQRKIFIKYWAIDRGEKKFTESHKTLQGNFMNLKLATQNIIKIINETDYKEIIERFLSNHENK